MLNAMRPDADRAMLLAVDLQEKLLPLINNPQAILQSASKMIEGAAIFELPVLVTEQYPKGIGKTDPSLAAALKKVQPQTLEKTAFSCCGDQAVRSRIREMDRDQIVLIGIETHVCILQTAVDLLTMDYQVFLCADAVGSRTELDHTVALDRLRHAGAVVTTVESVLFELCVQCDSPRFKKMLELIKAV